MSIFRFLIVDNEGSGADGYGRAIGWLKEGHYLNASIRSPWPIKRDPGRSIVRLNEASQQTIALGILAGAHGGACSDLRPTFDDLFDDFCLEAGSADVFVLDVSFAAASNLFPHTNPSNRERNNSCEARRYNQQTTLDEHTPETPSASLAGTTSFGAKVPMTAYCVVASSVTEIRLAAGQWTDGRTRNCAFVRYGDQQSIDAGIRSLNSYLRRRQRRLFCRLPPTAQQACIDCLNIGADPAAHVIQLNGGDQWTLATLFPREANLVAAKQENALADWIALLRHWSKGFPEMFCQLFDHPGSPGRWTQGDIHFVTDLEFSRCGKAGTYRALTNSHMWQTASADLGAVDRVRDAILDDCVGWPRLSGKACQRTQYMHFGLCLGLYPFDLAYIDHVAKTNARHVNDGTEPAFASAEMESTVEFEWTYAGKPTCSAEECCERAKAKLHSVATDPFALNDEGLGDISKLVVWRYRGEVIFTAGGHEIRLRLDGDVPNVETRRSGESSDQVVLRVVLPKLPIGFANDPWGCGGST